MPKEEKVSILLLGRQVSRPLHTRQTRQTAFVKFPDLYPNRIFRIEQMGSDPIPRGFRTAESAVVAVDTEKLRYTHLLEPDDVEWISGSAERPAEDDGGKS